jgi:hypothetical protein
MSTILLRRWSLVGTALLLVWPAVAGAQLVKSGSGANAAAITPVRDQFRTDLGGGTVAGANGLFSDATGARREINWDGVPAASSAPNNRPARVFRLAAPPPIPGLVNQRPLTSATSTPVTPPRLSRSVRSGSFPRWAQILWM